MSDDLKCQIQETDKEIEEIMRKAKRLNLRRDEKVDWPTSEGKKESDEIDENEQHLPN